MVGAGRSSPTPPCTDVEGDADSFSAVNLVNPFPVLVGDQLRCGALMILVAVITVAEVATVGGRKGLGGSTTPGRKASTTPSSSCAHTSTTNGGSPSLNPCERLTKLRQNCRHKVCHFMLIKQLLIKNQTVGVISPAYPRGVRFDDITTVGRPILCTIRPRRDYAEEIPEHVNTGKGTFPPGASSSPMTKYLCMPQIKFSRISVKSSVVI